MMLDTAAISEDLANHAEAFCRSWFPNGRKVGNYWQLGDTTGIAGRSLSIRLHTLGGQKAGKWADYATAEYGDLLDLIEVHTGSSTREARQEALAFLGQPVLEPVPRPQTTVDVPQRSDKVEAGRKLFSYGRAWQKTPTERYLRSRGISRFGPALAYHPKVFFLGADGGTCQLPAMLAAITDNAGVVTGCARTFLNVEPIRVANIDDPKRILGRLHGNAIRFSHRPGAKDLVAGEGLENVLSIGTAFPLLDLASCLTANHLALFEPPSTVKRLWIARDNDEAGERAASRLRARAEPGGMEVFDLVPVRNDFNADLQQDGLLGLRRRVAANMRACSPEIFQAIDIFRRN